MSDRPNRIQWVPILATAIAVAIPLGIIGAKALADSEPKPPLASPLTFDQAIAIALEQQPGTIEEIALEREDGKVFIEIEVLTDQGDEVEFMLDPQTGDIISSWTDDDPSDDPGEEDTDG
ncbi:MAG: PepSY domain-containing protein [Alphaproteobacteria bacterium]|nr:PepSY domain-containing protein [Alphaproteobacteria bacterium SS10]